MILDKRQILDEIEKHVEIFRRVSDQEYRIRCPICGDSEKDPRDSHLYIKCSKDPSEPLLFKCHRCNAGGRVGPALLARLGINPDNAAYQSLSQMKYNRIPSLVKSDINLVLGDPVMDSPQVKYITKRLGPGFTLDDLSRFKIVWDMSKIDPYVTSARIRNTLPSNRDSISFMTEDRSCLLTRVFSDTDGSGDRWRKCKIIRDGAGSLYTISSRIDLFASTELTVNIAEGVFDILSVYKNFAEHDNPNREFDTHAYIAVLGSDYISGVDMAILKGLIGDNVKLRIFIDEGIDYNGLRRRLRKYKWLFRQISICSNLIGKDVGVPIYKIKLNERII